MPRSYGSYFQERKKDKPYRGAEIALGFLGNIMESKNVQALQYDKLLADKEKADALQAYREGSLEMQQIAAQKPFALKPGQKYFEYSPTDKTYNVMNIPGLEPPTDWGEVYEHRFKREYLENLIESEDTTGDGNVDRTYVGPDAELMRKYKEAKSAETPGYENLHPDKVLEVYKTYTGDDVNILATIDKYDKDRVKYDKRYQDYKTLQDLDPTVTSAEVDRLYKGFITKYAPKKPIQLSYQDKASINQGLNERAEYIGWLTGKEWTTTYKTIDSQWFLNAEPNTGDLQLSGKRTKARELTPAERTDLEDKVREIETRLTNYGITYTPFNYDNPRNTAPYLQGK